MHPFCIGLAALLCTASLAAGQAATGESVRAEDAVQPLAFHTAPLLKLEAVGQPSVKAWYRALTPGRADDRSPWKQLVWFKKDSRTAQKSWFAVADFEAGVLRELPTMVPALEAWESRWVEGKYYLGTNLPARLTVFDPAAETLTDLGPCFSDKSATCYRVEVSPDGMIVLGGGTGSDVSLYDPKTKQFTHFGQAAAKPGGGTYAYYLSADEKHIYVAVRSSDPWELVRLDRTTKERKVLLTAPAQCHMAISGNVAEVSGQGPKKWYTLADGEAVERPAEQRPKPWRLPGPGFGGTPPRLAMDPAPIAAGEDALAVHLESPGGGEWRRTTLPLRPDTSAISQLAVMEDGRLVGLPNAYFAMVVVDPKDGRTERVPLSVSAYGLLPVGSKVFIAGYPSARTMVFDTARPMTWEEDLPGRPGVKETDPQANPKLLRFLGQDTGGAHIGMMLRRGADGNIYMVARRHRYFYGFALVWFNPEPNEKGEFVSHVFDDGGAFNHLQISAMQSLDGGRQMLISTQVQHNKQLPGEAPASASVFLFDTAQKKLTGKYEPLPGGTKIAAATLADSDTMVGIAEGFRKGAPATLFRYNLRAGKLERTRHVNWTLGSTLLPQSDGKLWGNVLYGNFSVIFTVDPKDLSTRPLARTEDARTIGMLFHDGSLYLSGYPRIMRVVGLPLPGAAKTPEAR